jgi:hypothetical protein
MGWVTWIEHFAELDSDEGEWVGLDNKVGLGSWI